MKLSTMTITTFRWHNLHNNLLILVLTELSMTYFGGVMSPSKGDKKGANRSFTKSAGRILVPQFPYPPKGFPRGLQPRPIELIRSPGRTVAW